MVANNQETDTGIFISTEARLRLRGLARRLGGAHVGPPSSPWYQVRLTELARHLRHVVLQDEIVQGVMRRARRGLLPDELSPCRVLFRDLLVNVTVDAGVPRSRFNIEAAVHSNSLLLVTMSPFHRSEAVYPAIHRMEEFVNAAMRDQIRNQEEALVDQILREVYGIATVYGILEDARNDDDEPPSIIFNFMNRRVQVQVDRDLDTPQVEFNRETDTIEVRIPTEIPEQYRHLPTHAPETRDESPMLFDRRDFELGDRSYQPLPYQRDFYDDPDRQINLGRPAPVTGAQRIFTIGSDESTSLARPGSTPSDEYIHTGHMTPQPYPAPETMIFFQRSFEIGSSNAGYSMPQVIPPNCFAPGRTTGSVELNNVQFDPEALSEAVKLGKARFVWMDESMLERAAEDYLLSPREAVNRGPEYFNEWKKHQQGPIVLKNKQFAEGERTRGYDFSNMRLEMCEFEKCSIEGGRFDGSMLVRCKFFTVHMDRASWVGARLDSCRFRGCAGAHVSFRQAVFGGPSEIYDCNFSHISFVRASIGADTVFAKISLSHADFTEARIGAIPNKVLFDNAIMTGTGCLFLYLDGFEIFVSPDHLFVGAKRGYYCYFDNSHGEFCKWLSSIRNASTQCSPLPGQFSQPLYHYVPIITEAIKQCRKQGWPAWSNPDSDEYWEDEAA